MDAELTKFKDTMNKTTGKGRDLDKARELADAYVAANPEKFEQFKDLSVQDVAKAADVFRAAGMDEQVWLIETWVRHHFEPQDIGGPAQARIRLVG